MRDVFQASFAGQQSGDGATNGGGKSSSWKHGETAERSMSEGRERKREGSDGSGVDGACRLSVLSQRLLNRWRDRPESVTEPSITRSDSFFSRVSMSCPLASPFLLTCL